jgi:cytochrome c oxidase subunit 2
MKFKVVSKVLSLAAILAVSSGVVVSQTQAPTTIEIHAKRYAFEPADITLKKGEPVKLEVISDDVTHSLRIDGLKVNLKVPAGTTADTVITPQETGDFSGKCGVFCGFGHGKMKFTVHVVDGK